jgi:hypothetical protein
MGLLAFFLAILVVLIALYLMRALQEERQIRQQPVLSVAARVITKYSQGRNKSSFEYYVVFEFETGERRQFKVGNEQSYRVLTEGNQGLLTYQGDRYYEFKVG